MNDIADTSDFTGECGDPADSKTDLESAEISTPTSSSDQKIVHKQDCIQKRQIQPYQKQKVHEQRTNSSHKQLVPNNPCQLSYVLANSMLAQEMLMQQNVQLQQHNSPMASPETWPGTLDQILMSQEIQNSMAVDDVPIPDQLLINEVRSTMSKNRAEVIKGKSCILYPPKNPHSIPSPIWVGGLPKNITENIISEIFERFGEFDQLRKKTTSGHVKRLHKEKCNHEATVKNVQIEAEKTLKEISAQINQIEDLFEAVCQHKVWDHFSKTQRKSIEIWKAEFEKTKSAYDDDMEISDDDEPLSKKMKFNIDLQEKNEKLRCEIEAYKNEIPVAKATHKEQIDELNRRLEMSINYLKATKDELMDLKIEQSDAEAKTKEIKVLKKGIDGGPNKRLQRKLRKLRGAFKDLQTAKDKQIADLEQLNSELKKTIEKHENSNTKINDLKRENKQKECDKKETELNSIKTTTSDQISQVQLAHTKDSLDKYNDDFSLQNTRLAGLISTFFERFQINITKEDLETLMGRCKSAFRKDSGGTWVLNLYNATENTETKEKATTSNSLHHMKQIVDSLCEPTPSTSKKNPQKKKNKNVVAWLNSSSEFSTSNNNVLNTSNNFSNSDNVNISNTANFNREVTQFPNANKPTIQALTDLVRDFQLPPPMGIKSMDELPRNIPKLTLSSSERQRLITVVNTLPANSVWSEQLQNVILLIRPDHIPLNQKYCLNLKYNDSVCSIEIPPTTEDKMKNLKDFIFPLVLPEEMNLMKVNKSEGLMENSDFEPTTTEANNFSNSPIKRKWSDTGGNLKDTECKKRPKPDNLTELLQIYELTLKKDKHLLEDSLEPFPFFATLLPNLKRMFKHISVLKPLLILRPDDEELKDLFSVFSKKYFDLFKKIVRILPVRFEYYDFTDTDCETESETNRGKLIVKHANRAQKHLKKLQNILDFLRDALEATGKLSVNYKKMFFAIFKYLEKLNIALNVILSGVDRVMKKQLSGSIQQEVLGSSTELGKIYALFVKKDIKHESLKNLFTDSARKNIKSLKWNISSLRMLMETFEEQFKNVMKQDYYQHFSNLNEDPIVIIENVVAHFSIENDAEKTPSGDLDISVKPIRRKLKILNRSTKSSLNQLKILIDQVQQISFPIYLNKEIFKICKDLFDSILKYLSNLKETVITLTFTSEIVESMFRKKTR